MISHSGVLLGRDTPPGTQSTTQLHFQAGPGAQMSEFQLFHTHPSRVALGTTHKEKKIFLHSPSRRESSKTRKKVILSSRAHLNKPPIRQGPRVHFYPKPILTPSPDKGESTTKNCCYCHRLHSKETTFQWAMKIISDFNEWDRRKIPTHPSVSIHLDWF